MTTVDAPVLPPPADPGDIPSDVTRRYQAEGSDALRDALAGNGPIARRTVTDADLDVILGADYLDWVLGNRPTRPTTTADQAA